MPSGNTDAPLEIGRLESDYELLREIGRGGVALVYLARDRANGGHVAVKVIRRPFVDDPEVIARFAREARLMARLDHPGIVRTRAVEPLGEQGLAIVMQYVAGGTLREALERGETFDFARTMRILRDVAEALRYAHAQGVVHRDVKPENIFLDEQTGRALLSDFGIARSMGNDTRYTKSGSFIGTPRYMSPEQIDGSELDGRSDLYSLGVVGWELVVGRQPWEGDTLYGVIYRQKHEELPRLAQIRPGIPRPLLYAIEGALHKHRDTRWANADEMLAELTREDPVAVAGPELPPDEFESPTVQFRRPVYEDASLPTPRRRSRARIALAAMLPLFLLAAGLLAFQDGWTRWPPLRRADSLAVSSVAGAIASAIDTSAVPPALPPPAPIRTVDDSALTPSAAPPPPVIGRTLVARTHADSLRLCTEPEDAAQRACFDARRANADSGLARAYAALTGELRAISGRAEPAAVRALRGEQRDWLDERDRTCGARARSGRVTLWAPARARCLDELTKRRADELDARRARLVTPRR